MSMATVNRWVRQLHRWTSVTFALFVVANLAVLGRDDIALWIGGVTLLPLILLLATGLYMFVSPQARKWRDARLGSEA